MMPKRVLLTLAICFALSFTAHAQGADSRTTDYMVPMRDGVKLATTVYLPDGEGPWPAVVMRTPYNKNGLRGGSARFNNDGYAYIAQDTRGRFESEGEYVPFRDDMRDGYDTVEWIAGQPFCNGKVGISGGSALGITANHAAAANPPHLEAAFVIVAPHSRFNEVNFIHGVFKDALIGRWMGAQNAADQVAELKRRVLMDDLWQETNFANQIQNVDIPMYNVGGWHDIFLQGNISNFQYLQYRGTEGALGNQKLAMGPFAHGPLAGDLEYPHAAAFDMGKTELRWFDRWLKGEDNGIMDEPAVTYYMMASARKGEASDLNGWVRSEDWPPASTRTRYFLNEDGSLSLNPPEAAKAYAEYAFDPADPVPTHGGSNLFLDRGPVDQRVITDRDDYLRFETAPLEENIAVAGRVWMSLYASSDAPDTDFMVKLVDVYPDGYEALVLDNPVRAQYRYGRESRADIRMLTPNEPELFIIDLWSTALTFEKGHRIAVHITSSNAPRFAVNPNTGEAPGETDLEPRAAKNRVYFDATRPSAVELPVLTDAVTVVSNLGN